MTLWTDSNCIELRPATRRALWSENVALREKLKTANEAAALYPVLLREGNHRIKNSLQIVSSLLSLQAGRQERISSRDALHEAAARIQAIASMHDALQAGEGNDWIDLGAAVETMCRSLHGMGKVTSEVDVRVEADAVFTPIDFARPILLAVNELVLNALRHAFPDHRAGSVLVELRCVEGTLHVVVADDGVGLPAGYPKARGFGMGLVRMMTDKIKGTLLVESSAAGTRITITTPEPQADSTQGSLACRRTARAPADL